MQLKGNLLVKMSPTTKNYLLINQTDNLIHFKVFNQTRDVPYCDSFNLEEEWLITSLDGDT